MTDSRSSFPREVRLLKPSEFKRVFQQPSKYRYAGFTFYLRENDLGYARLGLAIAKKHAKLAVSRNRIKRLIRESFRQTRLDLPSVDIIVMIGPHAEKRDNRELREGLDRFWRRLADDHS